MKSFVSLVILFVCTLIISCTKKNQNQTDYCSIKQGLGNIGHAIGLGPDSSFLVGINDIDDKAEGEINLLYYGTFISSRPRISFNGVNFAETEYSIRSDTLYFSLYLVKEQLCTDTLFLYINLIVPTSGEIVNLKPVAFLNADGSFTNKRTDLFSDLYIKEKYLKIADILSKYN